ncbi:AAA family ATPase [Streptococcus ovuberis]|uniref:AAA family ATPase n=1 Tax=Streptococcus ovuberis TaxID=1936207 RepID=A0A7X6MXQ7_9STRE|nr:AAA family ATPase [Streptococcus ovuberis]NKZ19679.1 AAA family ATPase [Streptococcus ovuberis]
MNVLIIGAPASGKMTVGQELERLTGATLVHNHETIDFVLKFIPDFNEEMMNLNSRLTFTICDSFAQYGRKWIGTSVINFNNPNHLDFLRIIQSIFQKYGRDLLFVELEVSLGERLRRNRTENRLKHKSLKWNLAVSEQEILETVNTCQYVSDRVPEGLDYYLTLDTTAISAKETAEKIVAHINRLEKEKD